MNTETDLKEVKHHKQLELCQNRPAYRQGRNLTAVKVYTVNSESQHLFIYGVPKINLRTELKNLCSKYGQVLNLHVVNDYKTEIFTECYHVQYERIQSARIAKRIIDNRSFYGGLLHCCYAPEFESVEETRAKLLQRNRDVTNRLTNNLNEVKKDNNNKKRKYEEVAGGEGTSSGNESSRNVYEIYSEDDPILRSYYKPKITEEKKVERTVYGPQVPLDISAASTSKEQDSVRFIPGQVKVSKTPHKRIVFRKKNN